MDNKRITLFCGHYGSGKTNVAVNFAKEVRRQKDKVAVCDLDIVNPYFRTKDSEKDLRDLDIKLVVSEYANTNVDIPALPQEMYLITDDKSYTVIVDVGGDDRGALALGRLTPEILREDNYEMLMVINKFRPLTKDAISTIEVMREIENACKMKFTGLVNNSNLGELTTAEDVISSVEYAKEISTLTNLPIKMTSVKEELAQKIGEEIENLFPLKLQKKIV